MSAVKRSITPSDPSSEPVSLAEAKKQLEIATGDTTHDDHVTDLITAARQLWEHDTQSLTSSRSVVEKLDGWPTEDWRFYYRPVVSVDSITYYDSGNDSQALASSVYSLDAPNRRLFLAVGQDWPSIETRWDAITITYTAGQSVVSEIAKQAMKLQITIGFDDEKDTDRMISAYKALVDGFGRGSYP